MLSGPLNRLNAIPSLLHRLDRYRSLSAIGSATGRRYLALSRIPPQVGVLSRLTLNYLVSSTQVRKNSLNIKFLGGIFLGHPGPPLRTVLIGNHPLRTPKHWPKIGLKRLLKKSQFSGVWTEIRFGELLALLFSHEKCPPGKKRQPKHKVFGQDIPGTSGTQTSGHPGQKLYASGLFLLF